MIKIFRATYIVFILMLVSSCEKASYSTVFTAPLLSNCEKTVVNYLEDLVNDPNYDIDYKIEYFSDLILSHQEFVGVVNIYSNLESAENIKILWNKPFLECYPTRAFEIDLSQETTSTQILNRIHFNNEKRRYLISIKNNVIRFWFADKQFANMTKQER
ncbi:MAG: hypothetical protein COB61_006160 [Thiotrichales bacterium]|nr:hypothetical protein [Thiotrichales bacterium]